MRWWLVPLAVEHAVAKTVVVACAGDSITAGGHEPPASPSSWRDLLAQTSPIGRRPRFADKAETPVVAPDRSPNASPSVYSVEINDVDPPRPFVEPRDDGALVDDAGALQSEDPRPDAPPASSEELKEEEEDDDDDDRRYGLGSEPLPEIEPLVIALGEGDVALADDFEDSPPASDADSDQVDLERVSSAGSPRKQTPPGATEASP